MERLSIFEHLVELRRRLIYCIICIIISATGGYFLNPYIISILKKLYTGRLIFIAPTEVLITNIKLAFIIGLYISSPFVLYQIWKFILPALYPKEKKFLLPLVIFSFLLFIVGTGFGLFVLLPIITKFLINIGTTHLVEPYLSISKFISYVFRLIISCGLSFELPIVLIFLTKVGIVSYYQLKKLRRYVILIIFIVAAILTPPDVISQLILALPMLTLYELSLLVIKIIH